MLDNTKIQVKSKFWATAPIRTVTYINGGIQVGEHWFTWNCFFEVNEQVNLDIN